MKHSKRKIKTLVSSTYAFLLTLLFFLLFVCIGLGFGVFNSKNVISKINESNYYNKIYAELNKKSEEIVQQAGMDKTVLQNVITLERIYTGSNSYINNTLQGKKPQIKVDKLQSDLNKNINLYFTEHKIPQTEVNKTRTKEVTNRITEEYQNIVKLQFIQYYSDYKTWFWNMMTYMIPIIIVLIGILVFLLIKIHHYKHRGLRYVNYALIAASLLITLISGCLLIRGNYKLNVMPYYYQDFLNTYLTWDIKVFLYIGALGLLLSFALVSLTEFLRKRTYNN